ncbi:hypothetical protein Cgig2_002415 [Carnegiea gigantea]|uniref:Neprosin activation peptide domain-containing protein n=1 Tax=Carnegiea gigantea TaxID=171969 RepID=A0A9Q1KUT5_9CARY|nr:hypothetical protein Cgig2_002415 [Carnegiea gigantea]
MGRIFNSLAKSGSYVACGGEAYKVVSVTVSGIELIFAYRRCGFESHWFNGIFSLPQAFAPQRSIVQSSVASLNLILKTEELPLLWWMTILSLWVCDSLKDASLALKPDSIFVPHSEICRLVSVFAFYQVTKMDLWNVFFVLFLSWLVTVSRIGGKQLHAAGELDMQEQLKHLKKPSAKTIRTGWGDIYDCVDLYRQPAFDHPLLRNHNFHPQACQTRN